MWMCAGLLQIEDDRGSNIRLKLTGVNSHLLKKILSQSLKRQSHLSLHPKLTQTPGLDQNLFFLRHTVFHTRSASGPYESQT